MAILSSLTETVPRRKSKPKPNPWDSQPDYQALKAAVASGRMKPSEQKAMMINAAEMGEKLGLKDPVRAAGDGMRRWIRSMNLQHDYWSEKYETNTAGLYTLVVTYDPAMLNERAVARRKRLAQRRIEKRARRAHP
jgi:hypothetical protein